MIDLLTALIRALGDTLGWVSTPNAAVLIAALLIKTALILVMVKIALWMLGVPVFRVGVHAPVQPKPRRLRRLRRRLPPPVVGARNRVVNPPVVRHIYRDICVVGQGPAYCERVSVSAEGANKVALCEDQFSIAHDLIAHGDEPEVDPSPLGEWDVQEVRLGGPPPIG